MPVLAVVQRAFPLGLSWKRRPSPDKGKAKDITLHTTVERFLPSLDDDILHLGMKRTKLAAPFSLQCDDAHGMHVAVKPGPDPSQLPRCPVLTSDNSSSESLAEDSEVEWTTHLPVSSSGGSSTGTRLARVVHWASIVPSRSGWSKEQERRLLMAQKQLAICQKAWSSEQELWLDHVHILSTEKAAHECFMLMRTRQQEDERVQFRRAWRRRRSTESLFSSGEESKTDKEKNPGAFLNLRRLQRRG
ncbi:hypothetical protein PDE_05092 [Penicillium oxalicum 114-2]|uniref:Uncharacterized protein n=1 Tax=Penicillium oxalicum (strain 114-2 / CGMCC 5302) TaxID=933388 RepID=S8B667_PENO1|nr:hypothetical protein PDE_05092 [Penicillium oxalicum 114-2]